MNIFFNYIADNKEWIFSGVGIFLLAAIWGLFKFIFHKKEKPPEIPKNTPDQSSSGNDKVSCQ